MGSVQLDAALLRARAFFRCPREGERGVLLLHRWGIGDGGGFLRRGLRERLRVWHGRARGLSHRSLTMASLRKREKSEDSCVDITTCCDEAQLVQLLLSASPAKQARSVHRAATSRKPLRGHLAQAPAIAGEFSPRPLPPYHGCFLRWCDPR